MKTKASGSIIKTKLTVKQKNSYGGGHASDCDFRPSQEYISPTIRTATATTSHKGGEKHCDMGGKARNNLH